MIRKDFSTAAYLMDCMLEQLPSDVAGNNRLYLEHLGNCVKDVNGLGQWNTVDKLSQKHAGTINVAGRPGQSLSEALDALLNEAFGDRTQIDVGEFRFTRDLTLDDEEIYSIAQNPNHYGWKSILMHLYRLGGAPVMAT
jgi:hypothetical protein